MEKVAEGEIPSTHHQNVASLSLFYRSYLGSSCELAQLVPLLHSQARSAHYSDKLHDFTVTIASPHKKNKQRLNQVKLRFCHF